MTRHDTDLVSLILGLFFAAVGATALIDRTDLLTVDWGLVWPGVLIVLGLLLLVTRPRRLRTRAPGRADRESTAAPATAAAGADSWEDDLDRTWSTTTGDAPDGHELTGEDEPTGEEPRD